jgi:hypothetical protein
METSRALIVCPRDEAPNTTAPGAVTTPFEEFVAALLQRRTLTQTSMSGSAIWTGFPVEQVLADGFWLILLKVAKKFRLPHQTELHVEALTPRIGHWINAGLLLVHGSPEAGAAAFETTVIDAVEAHPAGHDEAAVNAAEVWQVSCGKYFAALLKASDEYGKALEAACSELETEGAHSDDFSRFLDRTDVSHLLTAGLTLQMEGRSSLSDAVYLKNNTGWYHQTLTALAGVKRLRTLYNLFRRIPYSANRPPADGYHDASGIGFPWLRAQVLLAALSAPDADFILSQDYAPALDAIAGQKPSAVTAKVLKRIKARGVRFAPQEATMLADTVEGYAASFAVRRHRDLNAVDMSETLIVLPADLAHVTSEDAAKYFTDQGAFEVAVPFGKGGVLSNHIEDDTRLLLETFDRLDWTKLTAADIGNMLHVQRAPEELIAQHIHLMPRDEAQKAAALLMTQDEAADRKIVQILIDSDVLPVTPEIVDKHHRCISSQKAAALIPQFLRTDRGLTSAVLLCYRLDREDAQSLFSAKEIRREATRLMDETLSGRDAAGSKQLQDSLGLELTLRYLLSCELTLRENEYRDPFYLKNDQDEPFVPWERMSEPYKAHMVVGDLHEIAGIKRTALKKRLKTDCSEDAIFRWLYESDPDLEDKLVQHLASRDEYFRRLAR